jgi:hypothetical protein
MPGKDAYGAGAGRPNPGCAARRSFFCASRRAYPGDDGFTCRVDCPLEIKPTGRRPSRRFRLLSWKYLPALRSDSNACRTQASNVGPSAELSCERLAGPTRPSSRQGHGTKASSADASVPITMISCSKCRPSNRSVMLERLSIPSKGHHSSRAADLHHSLDSSSASAGESYGTAGPTRS